jgi:hypothetical protein
MVIRDILIEKYKRGIKVNGIVAGTGQTDLVEMAVRPGLTICRDGPGCHEQVKFEAEQSGDADYLAATHVQRSFKGAERTWKPAGAAVYLIWR